MISLDKNYRPYEIGELFPTGDLIGPGDLTTDPPGFQNGFEGGLSGDGVRLSEALMSKAIILDAAVLGDGKDKPGSLVLQIAPGKGDTEIRSGIATGDFTNAGGGSGFIIGIDDSDSDRVKFYFGNATANMKYDGNGSLTVTGSITATSGTIGGWTINATSIYTGTEDHSGYTANAGDVTIYSDATDASIHFFNWYVDSAGTPHFRAGDMTGVAIAGIPNDTSTDISLLSFTHTLVFSASDNDTVAWAAGTITMSNGRTFTIDAGNTGNMGAPPAQTWVYLDTGTSSTVLQTTTTAATAMGANKIIIAICQENSDASANATYVVQGGTGGIAINAGSVKTATLSAIAADLGTITAGTVTGATVRTSSSNPKFNMTSTAFQGIASGGEVVFEVIINGANEGDVIFGDDATGNYAKYDYTENSFNVYKGGSTIVKFGGSGADGALAITSGTTTLDISSAQIFEKNYTSISITSTGKLAFSNAKAEGTIVILKSQGNITLTSSTAPMLDFSNVGAAGGTNAAGATSGGRGGGCAYIECGSFWNFTTTAGISVGGSAGVAEDAGGPNTTASGNGGNDSSSSSTSYSAGGGGAVQTGTATAGTANANPISLTSLFFYERTFKFAIGAGGGGGGGNGNGQAGGGGGGGGMLFVYYNGLTANSGTVTVAGGAGGAEGGASGAGGGAGGGGTAGAGSNGNTNGPGGNGGLGTSIITPNTQYA